jgi:hypothetical protein
LSLKTADTSLLPIPAAVGCSQMDSSNLLDNLGALQMPKETQHRGKWD